MKTSASRALRLLVLMFALAGLMNSIGVQEFIHLAALSNAKPLRDSHSGLSASIGSSIDNRRTLNAARIRAGEALGKLPLSFEPNRGQADTRVKFISHGNGYTLLLTPTDAALTLKTEPTSDLESRDRPIDPFPSSRRRQSGAAQVVMSLIGAQVAAPIVGLDELPGKSNYFIGNDATRWRREVPNYARVKIEQVYRGVDVIYYGKGRQLEYDFNVAPGADFKAIRLRFSGVKRLGVDELGDLAIETAAGQIRQHKPVAYQVVNGARQEVVARYVIYGKSDVRFRLGKYDERLPLVVDPVLSYATLFGGEGGDAIVGVAVDEQGKAYVAGYTSSSDLPITPGAFQSVGAGTVGFVTKFDLTNSRLLYSTYLGGTDGTTAGDSLCLALAIDAGGNAYITGRTTAASFPTTPNAFQRSLAGYDDAFVAKLNSSGSALVYSTYLGASKNALATSLTLDEGVGIAVDAVGSAYVTGRTIGVDFPVTAGALKTSHDNDIGFIGSLSDAFVTKLNATGTALIYSTYLGGIGDDTASDIKVDAAGNAYIVGTTRARDFPTTTNPVQATLNGGSDAFVAKLNQYGTALLYSTYVGGTGDDTGKAIAIDASGNTYFTGTTTSTDLPVTAAAFQRVSADVNIYKSTNGGASWMGSNIGAAGNLRISQIAVDPSNPAKLYASSSGLVLKSTDGGRRWKNALDSATEPALSFSRVLAFDPKNPAIIYAYGSNFFTITLTRSRDGGRTWEALPFFLPIMLPARSILALAVDPTNTATLYVSTDQGLFKTTDEVHWISSAKGLPNNGVFATVLAIDPSDSNRLFADASSELFISNNGGKSWASTALGDTTILNVIFDPVTPSTVYASGAGLFKSTDSGQTWQEVDNDLLSFGVGRLVIDPVNSSVLYTTGLEGALKSTDGGHHWTGVNVGLGPHFLGLNGPDISLVVDPRNPSTVYASGPSGGSEVFVGKLDPSGASLVYLSYLGGTGSDGVAGLAVDTAGNAYVTGQTDSTDFPVVRGFQPDKYYLYGDLFVTKLSADGAALAYSTYLGGSYQDFSRSITVDRFGSAYVVGETYSPDLPLDNTLQSSIRGTDGFLARIVDTDPSQPPPMISRVGPSTGSSAGQYAITISGTNFLPGARVRIGGVPITISEVTGTRFTGLVNARSSGIAEVVDVVVSNPDGQSAVLKNGFTFLPFPRIDFVQNRGKELAVFGAGFDKGSMILVDGSQQKTRLEISGSIKNIFLLSKKAARKIAPGQTAVIQVRNGFGLTSAPVSYGRPAN